MALSPLSYILLSSQIRRHRVPATKPEGNTTTRVSSYTTFSLSLYAFYRLELQHTATAAVGLTRRLFCNASDGSDANQNALKGRV